MTKQIGPYSLRDEIGKGGNGQVFRARSSTGSEIAIKVLRPDRRSTEPLGRFKSEIALLTQLRGTPGVMPILDSGEMEGRPWFTMPVATPLRKVLKDASLNDIVQAFSVFATTLARLGERGIFHRDVKPENLFCLSPKDWVIGDFGIHKGPGNPVLTKQGRRIGPALYCAQEMLDYRPDEDHSRADVFSLAKTLWVIATGQRLPLQGQHPEGFRGAWLENYRAEVNTAPLDKLLIRATALTLGDRITMKQFEEELVAWLSPRPSSAGPADLSDVGPLLIDPYRRANSDLMERSERLKKMSEVVKLAADGLAIVEKSFRTLGTGAIINGASISNHREMLAALDQNIVLKHPNHYSCTYVSLLGPGGTLPYLHSGFAVVLGEGSEIIVGAGHVLCTGTFVPTKTVALFKKTEWVDADSLLTPGVIIRLCEELLPPLKDAVIKFADELRRSAAPS